MSNLKPSLKKPLTIPTENLSPSEIQLQQQLNPKNKTILNTLPNYQSDSDLETQQTIIKIKPKQPAPFMRSLFDNALSVEIINELPSLTQQDAKDECDINLILERFSRTGVLEHLNNHQPQYGDFTNIPDYRESLDRVIAAEEAFLELPAKLRERFANNALNFVEFCQNPENREELISLGLIEAPKPVQAELKATAPAQTSPETNSGSGAV